MWYLKERKANMYMKEKKWLKYLCLFALALLVAIPAAGVKEAQAATVSGSCGDKATYEYDEDTGKLTISGSGTVEYTNDWNDIAENVKTIVIGDKITAVGDAAFSNWPALKKVTLGKKVKTIGEYAFEASGLTSVTIPKNVTSIGEAAFYRCDSLTKIAVSSGNTKYSAKDGVLYNKAGTKLIAYPTAQSDTSTQFMDTMKTETDRRESEIHG